MRPRFLGPSVFFASSKVFDPSVGIFFLLFFGVLKVFESSGKSEIFCLLEGELDLLAFERAVPILGNEAVLKDLKRFYLLLLDLDSGGGAVSIRACFGSISPTGSKADVSATFVYNLLWRRVKGGFGSSGSFGSTALPPEEADSEAS